MSVMDRINCLASAMTWSAWSTEPKEVVSPTISTTRVAVSSNSDTTGIRTVRRSSFWNLRWSISPRQGAAVRSARVLMIPHLCGLSEERCGPSGRGNRLLALAQQRRRIGVGGRSVRQHRGGLFGCVPFSGGQEEVLLDAMLLGVQLVVAATELIKRLVVAVLDDPSFLDHQIRSASCRE